MAGIGSTLREARMRAQLDILDFESRTKIRAKYLRALEDEEWSQLPGYTFTKGFLRTYADMLGLDGRALVDEFKRQYRDPSELELAPTAPARRISRRAREHSAAQRPSERARQRQPSGPSRPSLLLVAGVLAVLLAAAIYVIGVLNPSPSKSHTTSTARTSSTHSSAHHTTPAPAAPKRVALALAPTGTVYVCLVGYNGPSNRNGHVRLAGATLTPASREPVYHADNHFLITFGNNSASMIVNGHHHPVATSATAISYKITLAGGVHRLAASAAPNCG